MDALIAATRGRPARSSGPNGRPCRTGICITSKYSGLTASIVASGRRDAFGSSTPGRANWTKSVSWFSGRKFTVAADITPGTARTRSSTRS